MSNVGFGIDHLLTMKLAADLHNSTRRVLTFDQARLGLSRGSLLSKKSNKVLRHYFQFMVNTAMLLGADEETARY